jgi:hypothetical protein
MHMARGQQMVSTTLRSEHRQPGSRYLLLALALAELT